MRARFDGHCRNCGGAITAGDEIRRGSRGWQHASCEPAGAYRSPAPRDLERAAMDREYAQGVADAERYMETKRLFGEELADRWEIERELREGWDY